MPAVRGSNFLSFSEARAYVQTFDLKVRENVEKSVRSPAS